MGKKLGRRARRGYTLVEALIVISIIGILSTVAVPLLLDSRCRSLDEKARQTVRMVVSAQAAYQTTFGSFGTFTDLATADPPFLDQRFASGTGMMGNALEIDLAVLDGGEAFEVITDNQGGYTDFMADESMEIEAL
jgi:prepilin-type N-terminal cleavage/methylation domain-containing protein